MRASDFLEIRIENTNSCGYKCVMCPRDLHTRKIGFMPLEDVALIAERIRDYQGHFHLHGFGEPLLDRQLPPKIKLLKEKFPDAKSLIYSTLGVHAQRDYFEKLADSGLDFLIVSLYGFTQETYRNVHGFDGLARVRNNLVELSNLIRERNSTLSLHVKVPAPKVQSTLPMVEDKGRENFLKWAQELGCKIETWPSVHNYGDGRNYNAPSSRMCPVITGKRKNILNITWNLDVIPCCYDFNATIPFGNLRTQTLEEIFSSPAYFQFTLAHLSGDLSAYPVCANCEKIDSE